MRIRVTYLDQNEPFPLALPESGVIGSILRQVDLMDWGDDWSLLELESPFISYGREHTQILIRPRWDGNIVGGAEPASVSVLLLPAGNVISASTIASRDFEQTAWCMAETLPG